MAVGTTIERFGYRNSSNDEPSESAQPEAREWDPALTGAIQ